ncbi:hypothetical protein BDP81DRAFT_401859 [Colletotrichum phormii]|uniref:Uncharacterized protein n=1 Tax=Colletotrichum phormii TaxID=359342 RepID=A0AAJ0A3P1_9PEZI|nr:uncharacterized protein BDP81DRAFT_401859 [Colletotrichum phormii]KAK1655888.1 hypothetical protein BDP81DRAFT_401859 [Colletotrichum phormii]
MASKITLVFQHLAMPTVKDSTAPAPRAGTHNSRLSSTTAALNKRRTHFEFRRSLKTSSELIAKTLEKPDTPPNPGKSKLSIYNCHHLAGGSRTKLHDINKTGSMQNAIITASPTKISAMRKKFSSGYNRTLKMAKKVNAIPIMWKVAGLTTLLSLGSYSAVWQYQAMLEVEAKEKRIAEESEALRKYKEEMWDGEHSISPGWAVFNDASYPFAVHY